ncbi:hypothetical protein L226DRAFT_67743 [Lentinus tigrinus ALCF2SS1-7]|uniref:Uncharacterized protein n=1 Tax=Lentinus tigrinus ALCF2SS1-6 TaxID=1328759 RepID=A0A5C2S8U6_9APHY|nr:hypothetical protein L227DRAFT_108544 [Lentinus tigrinus ALCF2SS1-6]RPD74874.1 hypothetical protein L226DRAFT_67743 [Lentinus tigrinus ALCF2SS1-7]
MNLIAHQDTRRTEVTTLDGPSKGMHHHRRQPALLECKVPEGVHAATRAPAACGTPTRALLSLCPKSGSRRSQAQSQNENQAQSGTHGPRYLGLGLRVVSNLRRASPRLEFGPGLRRDVDRFRRPGHEILGGVAPRTSTVFSVTQGHAGTCLRCLDWQDVKPAACRIVYVCVCISQASVRQLSNHIAHVPGRTGVTAQGRWIRCVRQTGMEGTDQGHEIHVHVSSSSCNVTRIPTSVRRAKRTGVKGPELRTASR